MIQARPVILCGGSGTRLWPLSRAGFPKQFLCITGDESLFQKSVKRLIALGDSQIQVDAPYVVTNEEHRFLVLEQLREIEVRVEGLILEPFGRNTAPAMTLAALAAIEDGVDPILVVTPADQSILDVCSFKHAVQAAISEAAEDACIVLLGVLPDRPEIGYGYIQVEPGAGRSNQTIAHSVMHFMEKPDADSAKRFLKQGDFYWNAGIFVVRASVWLRALESFRPEIAGPTKESWGRMSRDGLFMRPDRDSFSRVPSESVDYAVIEKCPGSRQRIKMIPFHGGWNDLGAWDAVWETLPKDSDGNAHEGDVIVNNSRNTLVHATSRLVALVGVEGLVVIETPDAVLVADKARSQEVRHVVSSLTTCGRDEHQLHRKVHRPWGWYDTIDTGNRFKVKRIQVKPGASLSLQKHHHRAEHWIVVKGTAEITNGGKTIQLTENQSTYIPLGEVHRLSNPGATPLEIIEVQSGSYLGEDDIVRFEDHYGRGAQ